MIGVLAALAAEYTTGKNVFQQVQAAPGPIAAVFLLFIAATAVPIFRETPRKGNGIFSSDAEIINGRYAPSRFLLPFPIPPPPPPPSCVDGTLVF